jgi:hypothetical protein
VTPVHPIGDDTHHQRQAEQRQELRQPDHAKQEGGFITGHGGAGDVIHLPADDDHQHQARHRGKEPRHPEGAIVADFQRGGNGRHTPSLESGRAAGNGGDRWGRFRASIAG